MTTRVLMAAGGSSIKCSCGHRDAAGYDQDPAAHGNEGALRLDKILQQRAVA